MDLQLVHQSGAEVLLNRLGPACDRDILVAGGCLRLRERALDPVRDEDERRAAFFRHRVAGVTREDENRHPERWIVSPPAGGVGIVFPGTLAAAEHPPSHHDDAGRAERFRNERIVGTGLAAVAEAVALAKAREPEEPF